MSHGPTQHDTKKLELAARPSWKEVGMEFSPGGRRVIPGTLVPTKYHEKKVLSNSVQTILSKVRKAAIA